MSQHVQPARWCTSCGGIRTQRDGGRLGPMLQLASGGRGRRFESFRACTPQARSRSGMPPPASRWQGGTAPSEWALVPKPPLDMEDLTKAQQVITAREDHRRTEAASSRVRGIHRRKLPRSSWHGISTRCGATYWLEPKVGPAHKRPQPLVLGRPARALVPSARGPRKPMSVPGPPRS